MEMSGKKLIPESRETVWKALNDPEILRSCIPGCQSLEKTSDTEMLASATIKVGPVSAKFGGKVSLSELNPPISYRITGEGQGASPASPRAVRTSPWTRPRAARY
ncbi:MAG: carbon monoxide dehydrogenase subunit G [Paracoccus aminovorans]|nr:carbon monoxide dehydrogenase subunit G [Paracoccus aminovorans]